MPYYQTCPYCGAVLEPGERCVCWDEKAPAGAANTNGGRVEQSERTVSISHDTTN